MDQTKAVIKKTKDININRTDMEAFAMVLFGISILLLPIYMRAPILKDYLGVFRYINYLAVIATIILISYRKQITCKERLMAAAWMLAVILAVWSNEKVATYITVTAFFQTMFPLLLLMCRLEKESLDKVCKFTLYVYNVFIVLLLFVAFYERFSGYALIQVCYTFFGGHDLNVIQNMALTENRFGSIWGHALTNAFIFNAFFVLNDCYYKAKNKKYPKIIFFLIALAGVLLTASKTAMVVLGIYFLMTSYKDKRIMCVCIVLVVVLVAIGGFDTIIGRFTSGPLTTGRFESIRAYLESGIYPIGIKHGYGTSTAFSADVEIYKAAFEFPILMFALDYGIIFPGIFFGSLFLYVSYQLIVRKQYTLWVGFTGLFVEVNTYNGISIRSHDICFIFCFVCMLLINMSRLSQENKD